MGNKLGKMVKIFYIVFTLVISVSISANMPPLLKQDLDKANSALEIEEMAKIYNLSGNRFGISIENSKIGKPTKAAIKNMKLLTPSDKYALSILDSDKKEIFLIGLGDPFYIHAQHIDYEESDFFGGYIDTNIEIALPIDTDVSYLVLLSQDDKILKKIREVKVN